jgi:hypothetical protein
VTAIITDVAFTAGFATVAVFVVLYATLARWHRNPAGRALMVMSCGFGLVMLALMLRHPFGFTVAGNPSFAWFQIAAIGVSIAGVAWITAVLVRAQRKGRGGRSYFEDKTP